MKKKIISGLAIFALLFFFGDIYIITTTQTTIHDLHWFSQLHHAVTTRQDLLLSIKKNQSDIILRSKYFAMGEMPGEEGMTVIVKRCFACHHLPSASRERITNVNSQIEKYGALTRSIFTAAPGSALSEQRADTALREGDDLIRKVELIIKVTGANLESQEKELVKKINQRKISIFALVTLGPFFAVGLAFFLIGGLTRPVNILVDATRRIKKGDLEHRITGLQGEFGEVAESFNEMMASLKKQMQQMQRTEQLQVCGEVAAGLAHEIRNPLAGMKVSIEVLLSELKIQQQDREVLEKVIEQIRHIELLMKNLLNYTRPVAAQLTIANVNKLLEQAAYFIEKHPLFVSAEPSKRIIREFDDHLPDIVGDPQQLQQVFLNLLLNAAEAIPSGGTITVKTSRGHNGAGVVIALSDTGRGIPEELLGKIFQPFFTTKRKGTGLGLAVSRRIVEEHGGTIDVRNNVPAGVTFTVVLPDGRQEKGATA